MSKKFLESQTKINFLATAKLQPPARVIAEKADQPTAKLQPTARVIADKADPLDGSLVYDHIPFSDDVSDDVIVPQVEAMDVAVVDVMPPLTSGDVNGGMQSGAGASSRV